MSLQPFFSKSFNNFAFMGCNCRDKKLIKRKIKKVMAKEKYKWAKHITEKSCITLGGKRYWVSNCTEAHMEAFYKNGSDAVVLVEKAKSTDGKKED